MARQCDDRVHDAEEHDRGQCGADKDCQERASRSQRSAYECHQRDVAQPHRFSSQGDLTEPANDRDHAGSSACADKRVVRRREVRRLEEEEGDQRRRKDPQQS
jgi:hypothetical protein